MKTIPVVKNLHTALAVTKDRTTSIDTTKSLGETKNKNFLKAAINDHRSKLKIHVNHIEIEALVDTGTDVRIVSPKSWRPDCSSQELNAQLLAIRILSQVKLNSR